MATLADTELVFRAISSAKLTIFETLTPEAGSNSFKVTTGPQLILLIFFFIRYKIIPWRDLFLSRAAWFHH